MVNQIRDTVVWHHKTDNQNSEKEKENTKIVKIAIQRKKVAWKEWLKGTNNEASARVFSRWEKVNHNNIIKCKNQRLGP